MSAAKDRVPGDPEAIRRLLRQPETRTVLAALSARDSTRVRSAAQAALEGDAAALEGLLRAISKDPKTRQAMETLDRATR